MNKNLHDRISLEFRFVPIVYLCDKQGEAVSTFVGHTQCVSSVVWPEYGTIYSASWDHSIRRWDVEAGKDTLNVVSRFVLSQEI